MVEASERKYICEFKDTATLRKLGQDAHIAEHIFVGVVKGEFQEYTSCVSINPSTFKQFLVGHFSNLSIYVKFSYVASPAIDRPLACDGKAPDV